MNERRPVDPAIAEYIRTSRDIYTREAITKHLSAAGHEPGAIEAAWVEVEAAKPPPRQTSQAGITGYVIASFVVGLLAILIPVVLNLQSLNPPFEVLWILGYLVLGGIVAFFISRVRVAGAWWVLWVPLVPMLYAVVWFGTCVAAYRTL